MKQTAKIVDTLIIELGGRIAIAKELHITPQAVTMWKKSGLPKAWACYLRERYPTLKAWQLADAASAKPN